MQSRLSDKPVIVVPQCTQFKQILSALAVLILLAGCAGTGESEREPPPEPEQAPALEPAPEPIREPVNPEVLFHVMAAESLGGQGEEALDHYLEAALLSSDPEIAEQVARMTMSIGDWERAVVAAERWHELRPDSPTARNLLASAWIQMGDRDAALDALAQILEDAESARSGWQTVAVLLGGSEDREQAEALMADLLEASEASDDGAALWGQSVLAWRLDDLDTAIERARRAAEVLEDPELLVWTAQLHVAAEDLESALRYYNRVRAMGTGDPQPDLAAAEVLRQMERLDESMEVLRAMPESTESLYTLGSYLAEAEDTEEAREVWERLALLEPEDPQLHDFYTAQLADQLELDSEALAWYGRIDSGPFRVRAALRRAVLLGEMGRIEDARALLVAFRQAETGETMERSWLAEAQILQDHGRYQEALDLLTEALTSLSESDMLLYSRALVAVELDDIELAEQDLRRILQMDPDNAMALNALGYTLTDRTSRHREAYRLIRRALELEPEDPAILDSMGWVKFRLGEPEEAEPYLREALERQDNPEIAAHLGEVLWHLDRRDEAREILDGALERFPGDRHVTDTRQRLGLDE